MCLLSKTNVFLYDKTQKTNFYLVKPIFQNQQNQKKQLSETLGLVRALASWPADQLAGSWLVGWSVISLEKSCKSICFYSKVYKSIHFAVILKG